MATAERTAAAVPTSTRPAMATNLGRIAGAVGVVLLLTSPLTWLLTTTMGPLVWGKWAVGFGCIGFYLYTNADFFSRLAGARSSGLMAMTIASALMTFGVVGAVNYVAFKNPKEWDFTREGLYTLSAQTKQMLGQLDKPVRVLAFLANTEQAYATTQDTLERYGRHSKNFTFEMVTPQSRPDLVQKHNITEQGPRLVLLGEAGPDGVREARAKDASEQELTYALAQIDRSRAKKIYLLAGHGEAASDDRERAEGFGLLAEAVRAEGLALEPLDFTHAGAGDTKLNMEGGSAPAALRVPEDAGALVVLGAKRPLLAPEIAAIEAYLAGGGRLVAAVDPQLDVNLAGLLSAWNIEVNDDLIVDTNPLNRLLGLGAAAPMIQPAPGGHPVVEKLASAMVMMTARSLRIGSKGPSEVQATALAQTGESAWGETRLGADGVASRDADDNPPPLFTAVASSRRLGGTDEAKDGAAADEARVIAFGDSDWASNRYLNMQGNRDLMLNSLHWAVEDADRITIRPKGRPGSQLYLSGAQLGKLKFFSIDIIPTLLVACGLGIVLVRRQR